METLFISPISSEEFWQKFTQVVDDRLRIALRNPFSAQPGPVLPQALLSSSDICDMLKIPSDTLYEWAKQGKVRPYQLCNRVYFLTTDFIQLSSPLSVIPNNPETFL